MNDKHSVSVSPMPARSIFDDDATDMTEPESQNNANESSLSLYSCSSTCYMGSDKAAAATFKAPATSNSTITSSSINDASPINDSIPNRSAPIHAASGASDGGTNTTSSINDASSINDFISKGYAPIHLASEGGGLEFNSATDDLKRAHSITAKYVEQVSELIRRGADPNLLSHRGLTPLGIAASHGHDNIILALLKGGASVDLLDHAAFAGGATALQHATRHGHLHCMEALLHNGADVRLKSGDGRVAMDFANYTFDVTIHEDMIELLSSYEVCAPNEDGSQYSLYSTEKE